VAINQLRRSQAATVLTRRALLRVDRDADSVFHELHDPAALLGCVPGGRLTRVFDDHRFEACVMAGVGPFRITYAGTGHIEDSDPGSRAASLTITGAGAGLPPTRVRMSMVISPDGPGAELRMSFRVTLIGKLASRGLVDLVVADVLDRTVRRIKVHLEPRTY